MSKSKRRQPIEPSPVMQAKVAAMVQGLERAGTVERILETPPAAPGIALERVRVRTLDHEGKTYRKIVREYNRTRPQFLAALARDPTARALALLAVGKEGVAMMERGQVPKRKWEETVDRDGVLRDRATLFGVRAVLPQGVRRITQASERRPDMWNCHHVVQKSALRADGESPNDPSNLVVISTFTSGNNRENAHHFLHAAMLHPQLHLPPGSVTDAYIPRPLFPFYPPTRKAFADVDEVRRELRSLDPKAELPPSWQRRLVTFCRAAGKLPYEVPEECRAAVRSYQDIYYRPENRQPEQEQKARKEAAAEGAGLARQFLPAGARVDGEVLPHDHTPRFRLPILPEQGKLPDEPSTPHSAIGRSYPSQSGPSLHR
ncbi:hypothetical protein [Methylacidimicrobium sp. B4]|uniref:hypothetical protein n=1 Tax=Methylacidimicrobium sp. B4 TaxID=2796139 RepID=UPI001A90A11C|nr:hypothetical protein [Methylacidimicrobium sp. B4]QSR84618.1 hypothetical protein MacB4_10555 [Methylacidimicrobium sp. B4]